MAVSNAEVLKVGQQIDGVLAGLTLSSKAKADGVATTAAMQTGQFSNRKRVNRLVDMVVSEAGWLSEVSRVVRSERAGEIPRSYVDGPITEAVDENDSGQNDYQRPRTDDIEYNCKKGHASWSYTYEQAREALASGTANLGQVIQAQFAKAMGNDLGLISVQGDRDLPKTTKLNRALRLMDGLIKQLRAKGHVLWPKDTTGKEFTSGVWDWMYANLPDNYKHDKDLRWMLASAVESAWQGSLTTLAQTPANQVASNLRDQVITSRVGPSPKGIPQILIPQMPTQGAGQSAAAAPTAVSDNGDGTLTARVHAILPDTTDHSSRMVKVTYKPTGQSQTLSVSRNGSSQNVVTTTGGLGQVTISTTASDYEVVIADLTDIVLINPKNLLIVFCDRVRSYKRFNQERERWEFDVHYEADLILQNEDAAVIQGGVYTKQNRWE
jgi:hypothetical protein